MVIINAARNPGTTDLLSNVFKLTFQQLRYRDRPNLKRPRPLHFNRLRMLTVCEPVYPPEPKNCLKDAMTVKLENPVVENPYAVFLAGQMRRDLTKYPLTAVLHYNNYSQHELIHIKGALYDMNYEMKFQEYISSNVARMALTGTKWSPILHLLKTKAALGFCSSDSIPDLQKALKKMPQFILLAAIVHGRILHKDAVEELGKLRDITNVRAQLCSTFALQSVTLSQNLTVNINTLSQSLTTYAKGGEDTSSSSSSSSDDSDSDSSSSDSDNEKK